MEFEFVRKQIFTLGLKVASVIIGVGLICFFLPSTFIIPVPSPATNLAKAIDSFTPSKPADIVAIGASHVNNAMDAEVFEEKGMGLLKLSSAGQGTAWSEALLKTAIDKIKPGGVVILSVSVSCSFTRTPLSGDSAAYARTVAPQHLPNDYINPTEDSAVTKTSLAKDFYTTGKTQFKKYLSAIKSLRGTAASASFAELSPSARKSQVFNYIADDIRTSDDEYSEIRGEKNLASYVDMIALCREHGLIPVLAMEPYYDENLTAYYSSGIMYNAVNKWLERIEDIAMLNYFSDPRFYSRAEYFHNPDHLNSDGAKVYSQILYDDLIKIGAIDP
jgi:hypothetical protein